MVDDSLTLNLDRLFKCSAPGNLDKMRVQAFSEKNHEQIRRCKTCGENFQNKRERLNHRQVRHSNLLGTLCIPTGKKDQACPLPILQLKGFNVLFS